MKYKRGLLATILIVIIILSALTASGIFNQKTTVPFYFGVEFAYAYDANAGMDSLIDDLKAMVDEVKDYTNLFIIGTPEISINQTALELACDYIDNAGLNFIILFTDSTQYNYSDGSTPFTWIANAKLRYGERFVGVYRFDEPGGNQLDDGRSRMTFDAKTYADAASNYTNAYYSHLGLWKELSDSTCNNVKFFTADYGLYWFDYKSGYDAVFGEFGANQTQILTVGLCRGAAQAYEKSWGTIITWTYTHEPYLQSAEQLYTDLVLSYEAGAKYIVIFNYPKTGQYGLLTQDHLNSMRRFWNYAKNNLDQFGINEATVAYVLPQDYGFGFRKPHDTIWGLWNADQLSQKIWDDTQTLVTKYGITLDIIYDGPEFEEMKSKYSKLYYWNQTII